MTAKKKKKKKRKKKEKTFSGARLLNHKLESLCRPSILHQATVNPTHLLFGEHVPTRGITGGPGPGPLLLLLVRVVFELVRVLDHQLAFPGLEHQVRLKQSQLLLLIDAFPVILWDNPVVSFSNTKSKSKTNRKVRRGNKGEVQGDEPPYWSQSPKSATLN